MTYLEMCQRAFQEAACSGSLSTTVSVTGEAKRLCDWVADADAEICMRSSDWKFLRSSFTVNTVAGDSDYPPAECTDTLLAALMTADGFNKWNLDTFRIYLTSAGVATQSFLPCTPDWDAFRDRWIFGSPAQQPPTTFGVRPNDEAIYLGGPPDAIYTVSGDYQRVAPRLAADADVSLIPTRFQLAVMWLGVQKYAGYEEDPGLYDHASREYNKLNTSLEINQLPALMMARPLC